jgi:ketosteroid isomerase-like protein
MNDSTAARTAEALLREHLALVTRDTDRWLELFADDAVVEFPYAPSLGRASRLEGKAAIGDYFRAASAEFLDLAFRDVRVYRTTDAGVVLAEGHGTARIASTGKIYEQDYVVVLHAEGGLITRYREYWNVIPAIEAFGGMEAIAKLGSRS